jgi:hypothetical protein
MLLIQKNKVVFSLVVVFLYASFIFKINNDSLPWKLAKSGNNISVYTRQAEGSNIKEFKAVTTVTAKIENVDKLIENVVDYPNWQLNVNEVKILKQISSTEKIIYYTSEIPWPIEDRDIVIHSKKVIDEDNTITYKLTSKSDFYDIKKEFIRIKDARGSWQLKPIGNNAVEITYHFYGDPGGSLPGWVINMFIVDGPYNTFVNLRKKLGN